MIALRTKEGLAAARAKGVRLGAPSRQDPAKVQRIQVLRRGGLTYRAIADVLNQGNVPLPVKGARWHPASVRLAGEIAKSASLEVSQDPYARRFGHDCSMTSTLCAFCEKHSHMTAKWAGLFSEQWVGGTRSGLHAIATCDNCGRASLAVAGSYSTKGSDYMGYFASTPDSAFTWHPRKGSAPEFPDVPEHIAKAAKEAHAAWSINAFMAAILMARTVVEATAKEKKVTKGTLLVKIDELATQRIIREDTKDAAHEIRHLGNDMAHGDISDSPDSDDVRDVLLLMDEVLREVFQGPAVTARLRSRRNSVPKKK